MLVVERCPFEQRRFWRRLRNGSKREFENQFLFFAWLQRQAVLRESHGSVRGQHDSVGEAQVLDLAGQKALHSYSAVELRHGCLQKAGITWKTIENRSIPDERRVGKRILPIRIELHLSVGKPAGDQPEFLPEAEIIGCLQPALRW